MKKVRLIAYALLVSVAVAACTEREEIEPKSSSAVQMAPSGLDDEEPEKDI